MGTVAPRAPARALAAWIVVGCATAAAVSLTTGAPAGAQSAPDQDADRAQGGELYQRWCAVCHATDGGGTHAAPPINARPIALVDLTMRTGSMPLADEDRGVRERTFTDAEREATLAYMVEQFGLEGTVDAPAPGDAGRGQDRYIVHCAQCHGASGEGGVAGGGTTVPPIREAPPIVLAQATRTGPFEMPAFSSEQIDDGDLADIVAFLHYQPSTTPLGLTELTRVKAFAWALLLGTVILAACWWVSDKPVRAPDADLAGEADSKGSAP